MLNGSLAQTETRRLFFFCGFGRPLAEGALSVTGRITPSGQRITGTGYFTMTGILRLCGNILIDPIFSERSSPVSFVGAKRFSNPPVSVEDLPYIDLMVISHDHYGGGKSRRGLPEK